jgi:hypothetical protein
VHLLVISVFEEYEKIKESESGGWGTDDMYSPSLCYCGICVSFSKFT